jgi:hypothetical protein
VRAVLPHTALRLVGAYMGLCETVAGLHDQVLFKRFAGLPIDAGCSVLAGHLVGGQVQLQLTVNLVNQRVPFASSTFSSKSVDNIRSVQTAR